MWPLNIGQVYTTLQRLERDGLVEIRRSARATARRRASTSPTPDRRELSSWLNTPPDMTSPPRDELVIKVLSALRVPGVSVHDVIQVHRRYLVELMQQWTRLKEDEADFDLTFALVVDAELFRLDSVVRWLDTADGRLKRAASSRPPTPEMPRLRAATGRAPVSFLELREISKSYGDGAAEVHAIQDVDLIVERGDARRGDGSERLGKVDAAHHRRQPRGADERRGAHRRRVALGDVAQRARHGCGAQSIGYVFQDFNLLAGLTAVENVALPLELDGVRGTQGPRQAGWPHSKSSVSPIGPTHYPDELSGGERQRVAIARAVVGERDCSSPTSRRVRSTRPTARR